MVGMEAGGAVQLRKNGHLVCDRDMGLVASLGEVVVAHASLGAVPFGGLIQVVQRHACAGAHAFGDDVQVIDTQFQLHVQSACIGYGIHRAAQRKPPFALLKNIWNAATHDFVSLVNRMLDGTQFVTLGQPGQKTQTL